MTKYAFVAATAAVFTAAAPAAAQQLPSAVIAVVDTERAANDCNACKTALTTLQGQLNGVKSLQTQLSTPLETEQKSIQAAINALGGKQPDAALAARIQAFEKKQDDGNGQLQARQQAFQNNRAYVMQQIGAKMEPAVSSVMQKRGATMVLDSRVAIKFAPTVDITNEVIAQLNATLTSIGTTAPAASAARPAAKPAGR